MQLLYVYIGGYITVNEPNYSHVSDEAFRTFKNVGFNLSNKFIFNVSEGKGNAKQELGVSLNESFIPNFFDEEGKVKSISAIVGKNGTGKSSLFDLIKWLQPDNIEKIPYKLILVYGNVDNEIDQKFTILKHHELKCSLAYKFSSKNEIIDFYSNNYGVYNELNNCILPPDIKSIQQIYYSPVFEIKFPNLAGEHEVIGDEFLYDISTVSLLEADAEGSINSHTGNLNSKEVLFRHKVADVERQVHLVTEIKQVEKLLGFKKPGFLEIIIDTSDSKLIIDTASIRAFNAAYPKNIKKYTLPSQKYFIFHLLKHCLYNLFRELPSNSLTADKGAEIDKITAAIPNESNALSLKQWISEFRGNCKNIQFFYEEKIIERFDFVLKFFDLNQEDIRFRFADNTRCRISLSEPKEKEILEEYFKIKNLTGFLHLEWQFNFHNNGRISSGEKAKFNLLSRFHSVLNKAERRGKKLSSLLILIDEGDTLFHPEWQRTYLDNFIKGLKLIFRDTKSIQIILTTHSPFVSSDLPWYSVIKLDDDPDAGLTKVVYDETPTFASNIHDLFADGFYMENGFVGQFAIRKIQDLFKKIETVNKDNKSEIEKEINLVGEPFIKMSLMESLNERLTNE